ncbi:hypothetical protein ebA7272 [Aromatoleum aromaticum EbN1]|uniref:Uncharacterized protein n=1 Tax=Aromatoleum aromaticum (strain DSM 19018 / LMG 30748 / EbN1) TaxID=76114 RepID=Q5NXG8_AROAE|nr:hypothetical protein ebA7272 [Aromatoleum aromaticum EbN1]
MTSAVLYVGPRMAREYVDPVPKEWAFIVVGALVFSAFLLLSWACAGAWMAVANKWKAASTLITSRSLSDLERSILFGMGGNPTKPLNLEDINYFAMGISRLEVLQAVSDLARKDLVHLGLFTSDLVFFTEKGRERALELQRESSAYKGSK